MTKRKGRPSGYTLNPDAFMVMLAGRSQAAIAAAANLSASHLSEMLAGSKGATADVAHRLAAAVGQPDRPGALFPEMVQFRIEYRVFTVPEREGAAA